MSLSIVTIKGPSQKFFRLQTNVAHVVKRLDQHFRATFCFFFLQNNKQFDNYFELSTQLRMQE